MKLSNSDSATSKPIADKVFLKSLKSSSEFNATLEKALTTCYNFPTSLVVILLNELIILAPNSPPISSGLYCDS